MHNSVMTLRFTGFIAEKREIYGFLPNDTHISDELFLSQVRVRSQFQTQSSRSLEQGGSASQIIVDTNWKGVPSIWRYSTSFFQLGPFAHGWNFSHNCTLLTCMSFGSSGNSPYIYDFFANSIGGLKPWSKEALDLWARNKLFIICELIKFLAKFSASCDVTQAICTIVILDVLYYQSWIWSGRIRFLLRRILMRGMFFVRYKTFHRLFAPNWHSKQCSGWYHMKVPS
jgi:hypothetical protein